MVQRIVTISFSPTGTTSAIVQSIGEKLHQTLSHVRFQLVAVQPQRLAQER